MVELSRIYKYSNDLMRDFNENRPDAIAVVDAYDVWDHNRNPETYNTLEKKWLIWFRSYIERYLPGDD